MERDAEAKLPDPMRINYRKLGPNEVAVMNELKSDFADLWTKLDQLNSIFTDLSCPATSREMSIAKTKLEESCMWAVKHITA